jgi:glycosyltransferase involved in cell wall biosynthesis
VVVIPAKNEAATVGDVVRGVLRRGRWEALVVDDASSDGTAREANEGGAGVVSLPFPLGAWGAAQTGLRYALDSGYRCAITMDADGQHLAESLERVSAPVLEGVSDVAIGVCPERASPARRLAWSLFRIITGLQVQDVTSGLRAYSERAIRLVTSDRTAMLSYQDIGLLLLLRDAGLSTSEVKVRMNCRRSGRSRVYDSWVTVAAYLMETLILSAGKWRPSWHFDETKATSRGDSGRR